MRNNPIIIICIKISLPPDISCLSPFLTSCLTVALNRTAIGHVLCKRPAHSSSARPREDELAISWGKRRRSVFICCCSVSEAVTRC